MAFEPKTTDSNPDHAQAVNVDATEKLIKLAGEAFNISSGITTWREFMGHYGNLCGKKPKGLPLIIARLMAFANKVPGITTPIDQGFIEMATSYKNFPTQKAWQLLGWKPEVTLEEGLKRTVQWLKEEIYKSE